MIASATDPATEPRPSRPAITRVLELLVLLAAAVMAGITFWIINGQDRSGEALAPAMAALLLVANLVPEIAVMVLLGRALARRRAARSPAGATGELHVRLVTLFSFMTAVPMVLVAITASLLLQYGAQFWSSQRAQGMLGNARALVRENYKHELDQVVAQAQAMSKDLGNGLKTAPVSSKAFQDLLLYQTYVRELTEAMIVARGDKEPLAVLNPYERPLVNVVTPAMLATIDRGAPSVLVEERDRIGVVVPLAFGERTYLYTSKSFQAQLGEQMRRSDAIANDYWALRSRARLLQFRFNVALLLISLLIVGVAVWIALQIADRLVRPVGELVGAARQVEAGDLTARVPDPRSRDEVGTLAAAFNQMTARLQEQNTALVSANDQLDSRRALIEAVMAGVSAGVIATGEDRTVRIANASAARLIGGGGGLVGRTLGSVSPELDALVADGGREAVVQAGERTLAVRVARTEAGAILTFDDITQQQLDQRRAAWADVARRIAHEIKNPLTPIQLAAERLQRRYGSKMEEGDTTFARLTDTIVRQVGDLRRMVDEFSSFARMPKPEFQPEPLVDTVRQVLFLHEVAHPGVAFELVADEPGPTLVCDRRQIGQALTNLVKNAVEAIDEKREGGGRIVTQVVEEGQGGVVVTIEDNGVGLPADRDRIVEPYMTTRARGTGLGLAIVKKIIEEHHGTIGFSDREGGGTRVTLRFDAAALAAHHDGGITEPAGEGQLATTTGRTG